MKITTILIFVLLILTTSVSAELTHYYKIELNKNNFTINADSETEKIKQFSFSRGDTSGSFYIEAGEDTDISYAMLTVNYFATTTNK